MSLPLGYKHSEETKRKIKETNILHAYPRGGSLNPFWGRTHSLATRRKIRNAQVGICVGEKNPFYGKKHSVETREKMAAAWAFAKKNGLRGGRKGENSNLWAGGITVLNKQIRTCTRYKQWRSACFLRDNYTCRRKACKRRGGILNVDHIKRFSLILREHGITTLNEALLCDELWDINNGQVLCYLCHKETPTFANKKQLI